jgi:uncharacterized protein
MATSWVVKASKQCNLRCSYCYEWEHLSNPSKLNVTMWRSLLTTARDYHLTQLHASPDYTTFIVWHGGEPLALPQGYIEEIFGLQHEIFSGVGGSVRNAMQSNAFGLKQQHIDLIKRYRIELGVSFDVISGVRITSNGKTSEHSVLDGMRLLRENCIEFGCISVIAAHTWNRMSDVYEFFAQNGLQFRALALREGGSPNKGDYAITLHQSVMALIDLFRIKLNHNIQVAVHPVDGYLQAVLLKMLGLSRPGYDRRIHPERVIIVNTDGQLYANELYGTKIADLSIDGTMAAFDADMVEASMRKDESAIAVHCKGCEFDGPCDHFPILQDYMSPLGHDKCIARETMRGIEAILRSEECSETDLWDLAREGLAQGTIENFQRARMV